MNPQIIDTPIVGGALTELQLDAIAHYVHHHLVSCSARRGLVVLCYTPRCANERFWTPLTRACRGLVIDEGGTVIARPFDKFFNLGEMSETQPDSLGIVTKSAGAPLVLEKRDGSLGIIFWDEREQRWDVCTKGSFDSKQAQHARRFLLPKVHLGALDRGVTYLAEIIYPENRIVVDYQGGEGLTLLGARRVTGEELTWSEVVDAAGQAMFQLPAWYRLQDIAPRGLRGHLIHGPNSEGYVLRYPTNPPLRVKVKSPWYVRVHALISKMRPVAVLGMIADGTADAAQEQLPPGLSEEFAAMRGRIEGMIQAKLDEAKDLVREALRDGGLEGFVGLLAGPGRGDFARAMMKRNPGRKDLHAIGFAVVDGDYPRGAAMSAVKRDLEATK